MSPLRSAANADVDVRSGAAHARQSAPRNTAPIRVRRARHGDLDALVALENGTFVTDRMSRRQLRHHLGSPRAELLVATRDADTIGAAVLFFHAGYRFARLYSIAVAPSARGAGVGERLLTAAEKTARTRGRSAIRLEVREDNAGAQRLYERRGYRRIGTRPGFYEDGHDARRYEKTLTRR